jgi:hypothetical protein
MKITSGRAFLLSYPLTPLKLNSRGERTILKRDAMFSASDRQSPDPPAPSRHQIVQAASAIAPFLKAAPWPIRMRGCSFRSAHVISSKCAKYIAR